MGALVQRRTSMNARRSPFTRYRSGAAKARLVLFHAIFCTSLVGCAWCAHTSLAQDPASVAGQFDVAQISSESAIHLEHARQLLAQRQWADAVEALQRAAQREPDRLVATEMPGQAAGFQRLVPLTVHVQERLAALAWEAPEALAHYRSLVDGLAEAWFREGLAQRDAKRLAQVVRQAFASRWGDDALLALGDFALMEGDLVAARQAWQAISPLFRVSDEAGRSLGLPAGQRWWVALRGQDLDRLTPEQQQQLRAARAPHAGQRLPAETYPDSDLDLSAVAARLALASILQRASARAEIEQKLLARWFPESEGELAGRRGRWTSLLAEVQQDARGWSPPRQARDWPTTGGDLTRGKVVAAGLAPPVRLVPRWSRPWPRLAAPRDVLAQQRLRVAEDRNALLSYYPIVVDRQVIVQELREDGPAVAALALDSGELLWEWHSGGAPSADEPRDESAISGTPVDAHRELSRHWGVVRFLPSASGHRLFVRVGSPVTVPTARRAGLWLMQEQGAWIGLDLAAQGRLLEGFPIRPASREWTLEAPPLCDGNRMYGVLRRFEGGRSHIFVAAWDIPTTPSAASPSETASTQPAPRWQTAVGIAPPREAEIDQITQLMLTLQAGRLLLNTHAGAVAALDPEDGQLLWLVRYPRAPLDNTHPDRPQRHRFRDVAPCLAADDELIVAAADCDRLFALEATTGELTWTLPPQAAEDVSHLLGVVDDILLASGDRLYWIDAPTGRVLTSFPTGSLGGLEQAAVHPRGMGRGVVAGGHVYWPTREAIYVFSVQPAVTVAGLEPQLVQKIELGRFGGTGGHLLIAQGLLLVATGEHLVAFAPQLAADRAERPASALGRGTQPRDGVK